MAEESNARNNAVIITPPLYSPDFPQLGPPVLKGFLRKHNHDCRQIDLNIIFHKYLMDKISIDSAFNPKHQQNVKDVKELLLFYFTNRFLAHIGRKNSYLKSYFCVDDHEDDNLEQFNAEVNAGMGFSSIVNSDPALIARFVRDRKNNYYHRFLDETGSHLEIAGTYNIIGFSLLSMTQFIAALTLAFRFKEVNPGVKIVLGGPWVTLFTGELVEYRELFDFYDIIVQGEGELPFLEILKSQSSADYKSIPNTWFLENGCFRKPGGIYHADINEIPTPDYTDLPLRSYRIPLPVLVQGSRGCYWGKCAFCIHTAGVHNYMGKTTRLRPLSTIFDDVDTLVEKHNPKFIVFADVSVSPARCRKLSEEFIKRKYRFRWFIFLRFEEGFDEDLFRLMREANCSMINFGLESGSQRMLDKIDKGTNILTARRILEDALKFDFWITLHSMAGLPGETEAELRQTIDLVKEYIPRVYESFTEIFRLEKGTRIFLDPGRYGITISDEKKIFDNAIPFSNNEGISTGDALRIINDELYSYYKKKGLLYAGKSFANLKLKDAYEEASEFTAGFSIKYNSGVFEDSIRVSTHGGGILKILQRGDPA